VPGKTPLSSSIFTGAMLMQHQIEPTEDIGASPAGIPTDTVQQFAGPTGYVSTFALIPIELVLHANDAYPPESSARCNLSRRRKEIDAEVVATQTQDRQLMAIMVADLVEYCRLMHADEAGTVRCLNAYKNMMAGEVDIHKGFVVDSCGDNVMAAFGSAENAVKCAVNIQGRIEETNQGLPEAKQMNFRMGIHLGDVISQGPCLYGNTINIAARLQSISDPGGIRISRAVYDQVGFRLELAFYNLGERYVKNIPQPITVYRVGNK
jgi:class 3 adenylate cyclase